MHLKEKMSKLNTVFQATGLMNQVDVDELGHADRNLGNDIET